MHPDSQRFSITLPAASLLPDSGALTLRPGRAAAVEDLHVRLTILGMLDQVAAPGLLVRFPGFSLHYGQIYGKIMKRPLPDGLFSGVHGVLHSQPEAV